MASDNTAAYEATLDAPSAPGLPPPSVGGAFSSAADLRATGRVTVLPSVGPGVDSAASGPRSLAAARPRFEVRRALGEGGIGQVFAAVDQDIGREVAIKSLRPEMQGAAHVARFVDEIRIVGALEHPNIVPIHDVGVNDDGSLYFVMRCVQGETLESIIERLAAGDPAAHAHWTMERRAHVFRQLLDAVAFAHDRGIVHRDIKPANVMVGEHGEVFLMDWGIAKVVASLPSTAPEAAGAVVGTPAYMSPEQARGEAVDPRSDVYSLCVLFHELLCLRHYLQECKTLEAVLYGVQFAHAPMSSFVPNAHQPPVPADLSWFVRKGLAKHAGGRYQSVREMIDRLDAREEGLIPVQCHVTFTKRFTHEFLRVVDRHPLAFTSFMSLTFVAGLAAVAAAIWRAVG
jgi:eukaryotic-like serine/threonine-protein kinase